jgi:hypothetical protein
MELYSRVGRALVLYEMGDGGEPISEMEDISYSRVIQAL